MITYLSQYGTRAKVCIPETVRYADVPLGKKNVTFDKKSFHRRRNSRGAPYNPPQTLFSQPMPNHFFRARRRNNFFPPPLLSVYIMYVFAERAGASENIFPSYRIYKPSARERVVAARSGASSRNPLFHADHARRRPICIFRWVEFKMKKKK